MSYSSAPTNDIPTHYPDGRVIPERIRTIMRQRAVTASQQQQQLSQQSELPWAQDEYEITAVDRNSGDSYNPYGGGDASRTGSWASGEYTGGGAHPRSSAAASSVNSLYPGATAPGGNPMSGGPLDYYGRGGSRPQSQSSTATFSTGVRGSTQSAMANAFTQYAQNSYQPPQEDAEEEEEGEDDEVGNYEPTKRRRHRDERIQRARDQMQQQYSQQSSSGLYGYGGGNGGYGGGNGTYGV